MRVLHCICYTGIKTIKINENLDIIGGVFKDLYHHIHQYFGTKYYIQLLLPLHFKDVGFMLIYLKKVANDTCSAVGKPVS